MLVIPQDLPARSGTGDSAPMAVELGAEIRRQLAADPVRRWSVEQMAGTLRLSPRTLQRCLAAGGRTFARLVAEARLAMAAKLPCEADGPGLAQIGFLSGFADRPHFTRTFLRSVGLQPAKFRKEFAAAPSP
jgi:transcriptional regulator GlxA family with amidase domain